MRRRVLVTGPDGFIGSHLVPALKAAGRRVETHRRADGDIARSPLDYTGIGHVVHLAARNSVPESWENPLSFYETNVLGAVNVLEFCRREGSSLTLLSSYVYGPPKTLPVDEDHALLPFNPYSHSKILAEEAARYYASQFGVSVTIIRPFNIYGPGQRGDFLIPTLIRQALSPECDAIVVRDDRPKRDYLYIADLIDLLLRTVERPEAGIFNAGSGHSISIAELVAEINSLLGAGKPLISENRARPDEVFDLCADTAKARRELGWTPKTPLREGLKQLLSVVRREGLPS